MRCKGTEAWFPSSSIYLKDCKLPEGYSDDSVGINGRLHGPHGEHVMKKIFKTRKGKKAEDMNTEYVLMKGRDKSYF